MLKDKLRILKIFIKNDPTHFLKKDILQKKKWELLHAEGYHPSVEGIINLINELESRNEWFIEKWSKLISKNIDTHGKTILEIGCGGGWYLAQLLNHGAKKVIGFDVSGVVLEKAKMAFEKLNLKNYEFYEVDDKYLDILPRKSVDIVFEDQVFQHIVPKVTVKYFESSKKILTDEGYLLCQFLMNEKDPLKMPWVKNSEGIVYYTHNEVCDLVESAGLKVIRYENLDWQNEKGSYWRLYLITP